jgi:hypothetical protein
MWVKDANIVLEKTVCTARLFFPCCIVESRMGGAVEEDFMVVTI